jgi:REP element-mobilizing transposase RayT
MPDYRRNRARGGTFFFTVNLRGRRSDLLVTTSRDEWGIWQRRYCKHTIRDDGDVAAHMDAVRQPLQANATEFSSTHRIIRGHRQTGALLCSRLQ